jgi:hypothetical protein
MRRPLTELDRLECAEYTLKILDDTLKNDGPFSTAHGEWIRRAKEKVKDRLSEYIGREEVRFGQ